MTQSDLQPGTIVKHYKHNPEIDVFNYTYEIVGIAKHTETDELMVAYRPRYESDWFTGANFCVRPLAMFLEKIEYNGEMVERFSLV